MLTTMRLDPAAVCRYKLVSSCVSAGVLQVPQGTPIALMAKTAAAAAVTTCLLLLHRIAMGCLVSIRLHHDHSQ